MAKRSALKPRKEPIQERSRATVEAILQAAAYILIKRGWPGFSTNAVAERAGVNIASLYQFFPNKQAIVAELERRHIQETRAKMLEVYARHRGDSVEARARRLIEAVIAAHRVAPELHRVFASELPLGRPRIPFEPFMLESARAELSGLGLPHPELASWLIATVVHAVVHEGIVERKADIDSGALADELVTLLVNYVRREEIKVSARQEA